MTQPVTSPRGVDVLAVMDRALRYLLPESLVVGPFMKADLGVELPIARAAVAELIEAAKLASFAMADTADSDFMGDSYHEAIERIRAALALATGAAP